MVETVTKNLGAEYDKILWSNLRKLLKKLGAKTTHKSWGVGGSQELLEQTVLLKGQSVIIVSETYIGLTITGNKSIIDEIYLELETMKL